MKKKIPQQEFSLFILNKKRNPNLFPDKPFIQTTPWFVFLALIFSVLLSGKANAQTTTETFSTSGTWICPAGVTSATVKVWGGGGSGGGSSANNNGGSGGGGGGYSTKTFAVLPGQTITYTIGTGGTAGAVGADGNTGLPTTLTHAPSTTSITANGGAKGIANGGAFGTGGTAIGGTTNTSGSDGAVGGSAPGGNGGNGGNAPSTGGSGQTNNNGSSGIIPGGGGGGGERGGGDWSGGAGANGQITITYATPPLSNDNCSGAITLTINPTLTCTTSTNGTTISATQSQVACVGSGADDDVWYSFTATSTSHILTVTPTTLTDVVFQVFSGTCAGTLTSLACVDNNASAAETTSLTGLTSGNTYFVRVHSYASSSNQGTFSICVTTQPACVAPSQASVFTLGTITTTSLPATFTGSANGYLVVRSLTGTP
ncbi:glycine-rich domain-containing protein, partial [Flavobacterium sp.]|uniref:glycine-rich domain-containing protein n=1 Tax=Flavobacterium sp. TaxID=239 RepID=UPI002C12E277|nr:hypothetical protein [Flavobacterium sp.]